MSQLSSKSLELEAKVLTGTRLTEAEALWLHDHADLDWLGAMAHEVRLRKNDPEQVTYNIDRNINYTNYCTARCTFCAFYTPETSPHGYVLSWEEIKEKLTELRAIGGNQVLLQGGLHPDYDITWYEGLLRRIKSEFPGIWLHAFSAPEIVTISRISNLSYYETLMRMKAAGLDSLPGGGAEILTEPVRSEIAVGKCTGEEWIEVHRQTHKAELPSTATMMFGTIESSEDRIEHLRMIRDLQDETEGFTAFICWPYQPDHTALKKQVPHAATAAEYLRMNAVGRLYLDNVPHFQSSWVTQGEKIGQLALFYGCDDFGSVMMEENVVSAAGTVHHLNEEKIRRAIERAGFRPARRGMRYDILEEVAV
ncbi:MAG: dehypoxanthine futalosine cyclase [Candidatus Eisenbacteria bacterium]|uniref:Cyclic dehypoxanthine futalosine synthase n=1 Tax=Eiseniibacteriota bacterium TaxID=2212470 RepID=A0A7Y2E8W5_UNCEI|nr:dehypoxanthine futalosine cyclase [Candidatus Eisenbacteria bacterium]